MKKNRIKSKKTKQKKKPTTTTANKSDVNSTLYSFVISQNVRHLIICVNVIQEVTLGVGELLGKLTRRRNIEQSATTKPYKQGGRQTKI